MEHSKYFTLGALGAVAAVGIYFAAGRSNYYWIEPLSAEVAGNSLRGSFLMHEGLLTASPRFPWVRAEGYRSTGSGGACLITEAAGTPYESQLPASCTADKDCSDPLPQAWKGGGYCEPVTRKCWIRPSSGAPGSVEAAPYCHRSNDRGQEPIPFASGRYRVGRAALALDSLPIGKTGKWRLVSCLNTEGSGDCGLGGPKKVYAYGPVLDLSH